MQGITISRPRLVSRSRTMDGFHRRYWRAGCRWLPEYHRPEERAAEDSGREVHRTGADREFAETSPFVDNAIVIGDRRKFVSVLIVPNFSRVEAEARQAGKRL